MQGLPAPCFAGDTHGRYAKKHDPFLVYSDVQRNARGPLVRKMCSISVDPMPS